MLLGGRDKLVYGTSDDIIVVICQRLEGYRYWISLRLEVRSL